MQRKINIFVVLRIVIGCLFIISGFEKLISPYQNFLYVIQGYQFLPDHGEEIVARVMPWVEFFTGIFLLLGFNLAWSLRAAFLFFLTFIIVVSQALIRHLPIDECGCFGELISFPPQGVLIMDSVCLILVAKLHQRLGKTSAMSLDQYFLK